MAKYLEATQSFLFHDQTLDVYREGLFRTAGRSRAYRSRSPIICLSAAAEDARVVFAPAGTTTGNDGRESPTALNIVR